MENLFNMKFSKGNSFEASLYSAPLTLTGSGSLGSQAEKNLSQHIPGIEPGTFCMRSVHSTSEPCPFRHYSLFKCYKVILQTTIWTITNVMTEMNLVHL